MTVTQQIPTLPRSNRTRSRRLVDVLFGRSKTMCGLVSALILLAATTSSTHAAVAKPAGVSPGETYQLVFVTSGTINATSTSTSIANYHNFAQAQAELNPSMTGTDMGVTYRAIVAVWGPPFGGGSHINPVAQAGVQGPLYLIDGSALVATNGNAATTSDLWDGTIGAAINLTQFGDELNTNVWTGARSDGVAAFANALGDGVGIAKYGNSSLTNGGWVESGTAGLNSQFSLYAVSSLITAAPAPAALPAGLLLLGAMGMRRKR